MEEAADRLTRPCATCVIRLDSKVPRPEPEPEPEPEPVPEPEPEPESKPNQIKSKQSKAKGANSNDGQDGWCITCTYSVSVYVGEGWCITKLSMIRK